MYIKLYASHTVKFLHLIYGNMWYNVPLFIELNELYKTRTQYKKYYKYYGISSLCIILQYIYLKKRCIISDLENMLDPNNQIVFINNNVIYTLCGLTTLSYLQYKTQNSNKRLFNQIIAYLALNLSIFIEYKNNKKNTPFLI